MFSSREDTRKLRTSIKKTFVDSGFHLINAMERVGSDDVYCKICEQILSSAFGVALITKYTPPPSLYNIYLEIGLMRAFGKEVLILTPDRSLIASDLEGKGVLPYTNENDLEHGIHTWIDQIPARIQDYNTFAEIYLKESKDYEKFFDYSRKAIMFGDFDLPVRRLDEVFNGKASSNTRLSRRLRSEVNSFLEFAKRAEKQQ
jgi:hypothetical protein